MCVCLFFTFKRDSDASGYNTTVAGKLPARSPYRMEENMGRGSAFAERYRHYQETGGVARWKNTVVMNIRYVITDSVGVQMGT